MLVRVLKLIAEIALLSLAGQALLGWLAGPARESNAVYRLLLGATLPLQRLLRRPGPRRAPQHQVTLATAAVLAGLWLVASALKIGLCLRLGLSLCR